MATHSSILAWRIPGMGEPGGLLSMGLYRVEHNWSDLAAAAAAAAATYYHGERNGSPLQNSCLENLRDWGTSWATVYGFTKSWTWFNNIPPYNHPDLRRVVSPFGCHPWPQRWGSSSWPPPLNRLVEVMEFQLSYFKSWKMMLWKCCTQYASKFGKLSSGHRTGKGQFSCQSQRKAMPKNAQTTTQLPSSHTLVK